MPLMRSAARAFIDVISLAMVDTHPTRDAGAGLMVRAERPGRAAASTTVVVTGRRCEAQAAAASRNVGAASGRVQLDDRVWPQQSLFKFAINVVRDPFVPDDYKTARVVRVVGYQTFAKIEDVDACTPSEARRSASSQSQLVPDLTSKTCLARLTSIAANQGIPG